MLRHRSQRGGTELRQRCVETEGPGERMDRSCPRDRSVGRGAKEGQSSPSPASLSTTQRGLPRCQAVATFHLQRGPEGTGGRGFLQEEGIGGMAHSPELAGSSLHWLQEQWAIFWAVSTLKPISVQRFAIRMVARAQTLIQPLPGGVTLHGKEECVQMLFPIPL